MAQRYEALESDYKKQALRAAKDFRYGSDVIEKIKRAKSDNEISRIMTTARQGLKG